MSALSIVGCASSPPLDPAVTQTFVEAPPLQGAGAAVFYAPMAIAATAARAASHLKDEPGTWLGWDVRMEGDELRWKPCADVGDCSAAFYTAPASDLIGIETVATTQLAADDGGTQDVEIKRLRFRAGSGTETRLEALGKKP